MSSVGAVDLIRQVTQVNECNARAARSALSVECGSNAQPKWGPRIKA